jgi:hypothetical protein
MLPKPANLFDSIIRRIRFFTAVFISVFVPGSIFGQVLTADSPLRNLVNNYCTNCHNAEDTKGELDLESILDADMGEHFDIWDEVSWILNEREMPPEDKPDEPRPSEQEYVEVEKWLNTALEQLSSRNIHETPISSKQLLVNKYCISCHNADETEGGMNLEIVQSDEITENPELWENVITRLQSRQMPPPDRKRPSEDTYQAMVSHLSETLDLTAKKHPNPGRVDTFRRMNRTEYRNAIRDLLGLEIDAINLLPHDEESHGFDNITVGNLSPSLLDRYISAAQKISRLAVGAPRDQPQGHTIRIPPEVTQEKHVEGLPIGTRGGTLLPYTFPQDGEYEIEVSLARDRNEHVEGLKEAHEMEILLDKAIVERFTVAPSKERRDHSMLDKHLKARTFVTAGPHNLGVTFIKFPYSLVENKRQPFEAHFNFHRHPRLSPAVYQISITGPFNGQGAVDTPSRKKIFIKQPKTKREEEPVAREILMALMQRAYRRPATKQDLKQPLAFYREAAKEDGFEAGIEAAITSILVNPEFIFRIEREPKRSNPGQAYEISGLELASRISFFLWSSIPDEELLEEAMAGNLRKSGVLEKQVLRMLADEKSISLVNNFASQWLHLRNLDSVTPDLRLFPDFDDNLRQAFRKETELFFEDVLREDGNVLGLLKSDYTYLNERLAHHYGIPNVFGSRFRRVELEPKFHRGGILRHGSILTVTSYATRTSPVIRGNWVLENIMGTPAKPPLPDVPALDENKVNASLPMRQRLEQHRANPACASCHNLMDPPGFALENFDAIGRWREYEYGLPVDASGGLPDGNTFVGIANLEDGLLKRPELFVRTLSEKLLTFGLGRGVEVYDAPAVRKIVKYAEENDYRFSSIILGIVNSVPFQMRATAEDEIASINP